MNDLLGFCVGFIIGCVILYIILEIYYSQKIKKIKSKILSAENIVKCFDDLDYVRYIHTVNETRFEVDGEYRFIRASTLEEIQKRINQLIDKNNNIQNN